MTKRRRNWKAGRNTGGCLGCSQRHVRCDGRQPSCTACIKAKAICQPKKEQLPLNDRRATRLPGEEDPWFLRASPLKQPGHIMDPFDCLPIRMPNRSRELLHYFHGSAGETIEECNFWKAKTIASLMQDRNALQHTLIAAGLHYMWATGRGLQGFQETFCNNELQIIGDIRMWLTYPNIRDMATIARHIGIMALTECSLGNIATAEVHLEGFRSMIDQCYPVSYDLPLQLSRQEEAINCVFILIHHIVSSTKRRVDSTQSLRKLLGHGQSRSSSEALIHLLHQWHDDEIGSLPSLIQIFVLYPFFLATPPIGVEYRVDATSLIQSLKEVTATAQKGSVLTGSEDPHPVFGGGYMSKISSAMLGCHMSMPSGSQSSPTPGLCCKREMGTSWSGISVAAELYICYVLPIFGSSRPNVNPSFKRLVSILVKDVFEEVVVSDLVFWKAFVGAYCLDRSQSEQYDARLEGYELILNGYIKTWSISNNVVDWAEAKKRLSSTAWLGLLELEEHVWTKAVPEEYHL
ncbi:hypothetical protein B0I35DRAFT_458052 [Stachybotrys elegans]|uniref:Zn(2)-C6 fungal-type domain-containing protein n=1 Tax=Stachybotrys elegans TaxID=80388 RepID=A0A8K0SVQ6_9HYPO|nr:hypothetical protein B0I35DRAFT_458052 [Stachybotrys elegans]